jgi:hypothetical protein
MADGPFAWGVPAPIEFFVFDGFEYAQRGPRLWMRNESNRWIEAEDPRPPNQPRRDIRSAIDDHRNLRQLGWAMIVAAAQARLIGLDVVTASVRGENLVVKVATGAEVVLDPVTLAGARSV